MSAEVAEEPPLIARAATGSVMGILALSALYVADFIYGFGQERFLTVDEYQWGHLTWLISERQVPYRDFYEHHLPLGYLFHSLFIDSDSGFVANTLLLRKIAFAHLMIGMLALGYATWSSTRNVFESMLCMIVPAAFGFSLMTAIEYRGDNWSAFLFLTCLALVEVNQRQPNRVLSVIAGWLLGVAVFVTQKIVVLGGLGITVMVVLGMVFTSGPWKDRLRAQILPHPWLFTAAATSVALVFLALGAGYGVLEQAFQANVLDAIAHEKLYPGFDASRYISPFLDHTSWTSWPIAAFALFYMLGGLRRFWSLALVGAFAGCLAVAAPYPYTFVLLSIIGVLCAVRGFCDAARWVWAKTGAPETLLPIVYLVPLLLIPNQLGFLEGTQTNRFQLLLLERIEKYSDADDVVLDSAGSALFRPHRSYYWYHGKAHVEIFDEYFSGAFIDDLHASEALFWIKTRRYKQLPETAQWTLTSNYIKFFGDLHVAGFKTVPGRKTGRTVKRGIIRSGEYFVSLFNGDVPDDMPWTKNIMFDGKLVEGRSIYLEKGMHEMKLLPGARRYRFALLPPSAFGIVDDTPSHERMFAYRNADRRLGTSTDMDASDEPEDADD